MSDRMSDGLFVDLESSYQMDALHRRISVDELWRYFPAERAEVERLAHIERLEAERAKHAVLFEAAKGRWRESHAIMRLVPIRDRTR
jgi:hypothetical protein